MKQLPFSLDCFELVSRIPFFSFLFLNLNSAKIMVKKFPDSSGLVPRSVVVCSIWIPWSRPSSSCRVCNPALAEQKTLSQEAFRPISCHLPACQRALSNHSTLLARLSRSAEAVLMQWERAEGCPPCFNKHWH